MNIKVNKDVFKQYDIRGIVGENIDKEFAQNLGKAFGSYIQQYNLQQVIVGHDCRESSDELNESLINGLISTGVDVKDIGLATTPMVYYARKLLKIGPAIQITASHNPREYNGFKMCIEENAEVIYGDRILEIYDFMIKGEFLSGTGTIEKVSVKERYIEEITKRVVLQNKNIKVVIDCGNATPSIITAETLEKLGVKVVQLYCDIDSTFPNHHPDPAEAKNMVDLAKKVQEVGADVGFAFDGDGDRIGVVDEKGNMIFGDDYMRIMWKEIIKKYPHSRALVEVKCSQNLWDELEELGAKPEFIRTGSPIIKAAIKEENIPFSGETSGHIYFRDEYYGFDDGLYAAARFLRLMSSENKKVSEMLGAKKYVVSSELNKVVEEKSKFEIVDKAVSYFKSLGNKVIDVDGARVVFDDGWGLVRASNTTPKLTLRFEAKTQEGLERIEKEFDTMFEKIQ
ncbi:MAG: phosphomannomutase/phosphoglucomutase [Oscillospiraceae bacterium]|nr:phosphomannomutase/phosphoglucomutase [Oscillospiraceae bacterium]